MPYRRWGYRVECIVLGSRLLKSKAIVQCCWELKRFVAGACFENSLNLDIEVEKLLALNKHVKISCCAHVLKSQ
jgi:hypothetical protein